MLWRLGTTPSGADGQTTHFGTHWRYPFLSDTGKGMHADVTGGLKAHLSRRELEVAALVAQGLTNREIAKRLFISERTADGHLEHIRDKLGVGTRAQITAWLVRQEAAASESAPVELPTGPLMPGEWSRLPMRNTDFIGRENDLAELARLLQRARLVTLTGPGGAGKTRLALEMAARMSGLFLDGAFLVDLAPLSDPALVVRTLAQATGTVDQLRVTPLEAVAGRLEHARALLLLDNCEHLIDAAAAATETLLMQTKVVRVVATSREPLNLDGEAVWRLGPLSAAESLALFVNRAELVAPGRSVDEAVAADICTRLDGLPLGIELAAARVGTMSLEEIRNRLDDRFRLLVTGARRRPARQRTLQAAVEWSYGLLEETDRAVFRRLAVFAGGFDLESAEAVCGLGSLDALARLVNKSLVVPDTWGPRTRYSLLETLREFATARLQDAGEEVTARAAHAGHYAGIASQSLDATITTTQMAWLVRTEQEAANLRVALDFLAGFGNDGALLLASALGSLALFRGHRYAQAEELAALLGSREWPAGRPLATAATLLAWLQGDDHAEAALRSAHRALALWRDLGDIPGEQWALTTVGYICVTLGDLDSAEAFGGQALALAEARGLSARLALQVIGMAAGRRGDFEHAVGLLERARAEAEKDGDASGRGTSTCWLAQFTLALGDRAKAERLFEHVLAVAPGMHVSFKALMQLAQLALDRGNRVLARARWLECLEAIHRQHRVDDLPDCLEGLARLATAERDRSRATQLAELAVSVRARTCSVADAIAYAQGHQRRAANLTVGRPASR
jgi:predicted ATPase/DNA-binding CsgD family transcriptional regulator